MLTVQPLVPWPLALIMINSELKEGMTTIEIVIMSLSRYPVLSCYSIICTFIP